MNRFAELLDRLAYEPGRNNKLRLFARYFREVEDPDRGYALAALTGALAFKHAKPGLLRDRTAKSRKQSQRRFLGRARQRLSLFPPPLWGRVRERGIASTALMMTNDPTATTTRRLPP